MKALVPDEVILGLLKAHPTHGYELLDRFQSRSQLGRIWSMSSSQLYAVLKRLECDGAIIGRRIEVHNAPDRIQYNVTGLGEALIKAWINEPQPSTSIHRIRVQFLSRLFIADLLGKPCENIIIGQIKACERQRKKLIEALDRTEAPIEKLTLAYVIGQLDAALSWLDKIADYLPLHLHEVDKSGQK